MDAATPIVAVVDDDAGIRDSIRSLLKLAGYACAVFSSADEFKQADLPPETKCVVLDMKMPGMNGLQLLRLMKTLHPSLPLIFTTAHYDENIRKRAMNEGAVSFLSKPFDTQELLTTIAACIPSDARQARYRGALKCVQANEASDAPRPNVQALADARDEERHPENVRIAREAHDRLTPGFSSASPQVYEVADCAPERVHGWSRLTRAINPMRSALDNWMRSVLDLRPSRNASSKLVELFAQIQDELEQFMQPGEQPKLLLICEGRARPLRAAVESELYGIGREALINALRHAHARNIEIAVVFHSNSLSLTVRDDGRGIEPKLAGAGNHKHLGLSAIRDQADRIGALLRVWSARGCGTELELKVPGAVAFLQRPRFDVPANGA